MDRFLSIRYELTPRQGLHGVIADLSDWCHIHGFRRFAWWLAELAYSKWVLP
jgi:hypothetical protein